jgi:hypothetical protein
LSKGNGVTGLPGLAKGGTITGMPGIDTNLLSINGMPTARVNTGEQIRIEPNNDNSRGGTVIHQNIGFSGGVDLATRTEVYRVADAARQAAINGVNEAARRRG